jgi:hypothetical protein
VAVVVSVAIAPFAAEAGTSAGAGFELGPFTGFIAPDKRLIATRDPGVEPTLGLWVGGGLAYRWNWFSEVQLAQFRTRTFAGDADMLAGRVGTEFLIEPGRRAESFVAAGWGYTRMTFDAATDYTSGFASVGLGQHIRLDARTRLRWEVRVDRMMAPDGLRGHDLTHPQATVGFHWALDRARRDGDQDGVSGRRDDCPDTPAGASVDARGCPIDSDGDAVPDGLDACAATPAGWQVQPDGCPLDSDGDGAADAVDVCAATASGVIVDKTGCPLDSDGDGVFDGLDRCPETMKGIEVNARGCFLDADEDGVYDGLGMDRCPGTPKGTRVDRFGCPVREDRGD